MGFDTFLVVRHGVKMEPASGASKEMTLTSEPKATSSLHRSIHGSELGCYFCNDVVAPGNVRAAFSQKVSDYVLIFHFVGYVPYAMNSEI